MTIWMDVTTILAWNRPPVGIVRTELECARYVVEVADPERLSLCYYDKRADEFRRLSTDHQGKVCRLLAGEYSDVSAPPSYADIIASVSMVEITNAKGLTRLLFGAGSLLYSVDPVENERIRGWVFDRKRPHKRIVVEFRSEGELLYSKVADEFRQDLLDVGMSDGHCSFEVPISSILDRLRSSGASIVQLFAQGKKPYLIGELSIDADALARHAPDAPLRAEGEPVQLTEDDVYITAGLDWEYKDFRKIYRKKKRDGFRIVGFCYDLIPVKFPQWCVEDVASFFSNYFVELSWCADHILCISECSRNDYLEFAASAGCPTVETSVVRLGSNLKSCGVETKIRPEISSVARSRYLLFVSTIERRKNHEVLYRAFTRLVDAGLTDLPKLVFVGMRGWGVSELFADISLDPRTKGLIEVKDRVSDEELELLYRNALFTLFPSLYEGWGLPVAESLAYGKYCLASRQGSIPEIAGDLLEYLDPWNVQSWADRIGQLITNSALLAEKEARIRSNFRADTWDSCVGQVFGAAAALRHTNAREAEHRSALVE